MFHNILSEDGRVTNFRSLVKAYINYTSASGKPYMICFGILLFICILKSRKSHRDTEICEVYGRDVFKPDL